LRTDHWRPEVDLLLINVAISACDMGGSYKQKPSTFGGASILDLQLASLKALLASFLSSPYARPPYLAKGIELFTKGNSSSEHKCEFIRTWFPVCHFDCKYPYKYIILHRKAYLIMNLLMSTLYSRSTLVFTYFWSNLKSLLGTNLDALVFVIG
jgi:hypothetical protein